LRATTECGPADGNGCFRERLAHGDLSRGALGQGHAEFRSTFIPITCAGARRTILVTGQFLNSQNLRPRFHARLDPKTMASRMVKEPGCRSSTTRQRGASRHTLCSHFAVIASPTVRRFRANWRDQPRAWRHDEDREPSRSIDVVLETDVLVVAAGLGWPQPSLLRGPWRTRHDRPNGVSAQHQQVGSRFRLSVTSTRDCEGIGIEFETRAKPMAADAGAES